MGRAIFPLEEIRQKRKKDILWRLPIGFRLKHHLLSFFLLSSSGSSGTFLTAVPKRQLCSTALTARGKT
jgi:hypothetical protein